MNVEWLPVTRFEQNCSILWCEATRKAAIIDPGGDLDQLEMLLELEGLDLEVVLVTHGHFDHAGGAAALAAATGARIEGPHRGDEHLIAKLAEQGRKYGGVRAESYTPDRWLSHGDQIRFGEETLEVLHCPGHTRGHVAYFHRPSRFAFVGDILFRGAIGAWEHADGDLPLLLQSIRSKLFALGDDVRFLPGHGETSTFGRERISNPFVGDDSLAMRRARAQGGLSEHI
jgi:glyoxylase-like metal-dependent hydrolase (beta-lactamase superfamily II)